MSGGRRVTWISGTGDETLLLPGVSATFRITLQRCQKTNKEEREKQTCSRFSSFSCLNVRGKACHLDKRDGRRNFIVAWSVRDVQNHAATLPKDKQRRERKTNLLAFLQFL